MVKLRTLGECLIEVGDARIGPDSKVVFALLLYLGLERGKRITRTALMEMFWPNSSPAKAAHSLRQTIYQCRKLGVKIEATKINVSLDAGGVESDLDKAGVQEHTVPNSSEFLPSYSGRFSDQFDEWLEQQRLLVQAKLRRRMLLAVKQLRARGDWEGMDRSSRELLRLDPLNEEGTLSLAEATAMRGNKVAALNILDRFAADVGQNPQVLLPTTVLRKRIADQFEGGVGSSAPMVGRSRASEFLRSHLKNAKIGDGRTLLLWGDPGIGKSRLISELQQTGKLEGFAVVKVDCQPTDTMRPFSVFAEAIPSLLEERGSLGCDPSALKWLRLLSHGTNERPASEDIHAHLDVVNSIRGALLDLFDAVISERPVVFIVEDVHWLDGASWQIASVLSRWCRPKRFLIVLTSRSQCPDDGLVDASEAIVRYSIERLSLDDSRKLFDHFSSESSTVPAERDRDWFISVADGNPFFLKELARHYAVARSAYSIPASLESLLSARLRRISANALRLLQVCALLGRHATLERIEDVLQLAAFDLIQSLEELERLELVTSDGPRLATKHALLADQAVRLCTSATKKLLHRRIAVRIELEALRTHNPTLTWECAAHWLGAGELERGITVTLDCSAQLVALGLPNDAVNMLLKAQPLTSEPSLQYSLLLALGGAYHAGYDHEGESNALSEALVLRNSSQTNCSQHDDHELQLLEAGWRSNAARGVGGSASFLLQAAKCARSIEASRPHRLKALRFGLVVGDFTLSLNDMHVLMEEGKELLADESLPLVDRLVPTTIFHAVCGDLETAVDSAERLTNIHRQAGRTAALITWLRNASIPLRLAGRYDDALSAIYEAIEIARKNHLNRFHMLLLDSAATIYMMRDRIDEAKQAIEIALSLSDQTANVEDYRSLRRMRAYVALAENDLEGAEAAHDFAPSEFSNDTLRIRDEELGVQLIKQCLGGRPVDEQMLRLLEVSHLGSRSAGRLDLPTAALVTAIRATGRESYARELWSEYQSKWRRERGPVPAHLLRMVGLGASRKERLLASEALTPNVRS